MIKSSLRIQKYAEGALRWSLNHRFHDISIMKTVVYVYSLLLISPTDIKYKIFSQVLGTPIYFLSFLDNKLFFEQVPSKLTSCTNSKIKIFIQKMRSCCMKFKAHVCTEVHYVFKLITAPQPELRFGLFNVPAAIQQSVFRGRK